MNSDMRKIKVVYIADMGIEGGATKSMIELVSNLKENFNIYPIVLTSKKCILNDLLNMYEIENFAIGHSAFMHGAPDSWWKKPIKWVLYGIYYVISYHSSYKKAMNVIDWSTVDLIHTNVARDDIGMRISKKFEIPNMCHIREFAELDFNCWSYRPKYIRYLSNNVDKFIAISETVKNYWVSKGLPSDKISVIYNGVDSKKIKKADRINWTIDKTIKLVIVGGVIPNKGQWQAIEALQYLPNEILPYVQLDIIGKVSTSYKKKLISQIKNPRVIEQINFLGAKDNVYDCLRDYHIGLMCSKAEAFGRVTVEYMNAGLAVIATNTGANSELIKNGVNGLIYPYNDTLALAELIQNLYNNRKMLIKISSAGEEFAGKFFTKEVNAENIYSTYKSLLTSFDM